MMKSLFLLVRLVLPFLLIMIFTIPAFACTTCNRPLQAAIFDESFLKLLFYMLLPFLIIGVAVYRLHKLK